jgi:hypothetical protein
MKQNYINHIALVIDDSSSMGHLRDAVIKVADAQIEHMARRSKELDQETRITVYRFSNKPECLIYDKDVLRMPSLAGKIGTGGNTALIDATCLAIDDLAKTPELYGDHAFLVYVLTDGEENQSPHRALALANKIGALADNWTVACFVPDQGGKFEAKRFGFPSDNIAIWDTSAKGFAEVGETIRKTTDAYMTARSTGVRGSKGLFALDVQTASKGAVAATCTALNFGQFRLLDVTQDGPISDFVESRLKRSYKLGEGYYQLTKREEVQPQKGIALLEVKTKKVYTGPQARKLLGLPDYNVKIAPASHPDFLIFVQSTSTNRKLIAGTRLLVLS